MSGWKTEYEEKAMTLTGPLMMFVVGERPTLVATFEHCPGRTFKVKVRRVMTALREGEVDAPGRVPVVFDYDEDVAGLNLPVGSQATVAVYTERVHALSIRRKIVLRIHAWENDVF